MGTFSAMDLSHYWANLDAAMSEVVVVRRQEFQSRLQKAESRLQKVKSMPKGSSINLREGGLWGMEENYSELEEALSKLEERNLRLRNLEESPLPIIQAMSIFEVSLGSDSMEGPKTLLYEGPIKPSKRANEMRDCNKKLSDRLASLADRLCTVHVENGKLPVFGPVAAAQEEERKHQVTLSERKLRQLVLEMGPNRRGVGLSQHRRRAPLSYQKEFLTLCLRTKIFCMRNQGGLYSSQSYLWSLTFNLSRPDEDSSMLEESQLLNNRAMSISRETLGSGSTKWPKLLLNKGPTKPGEPASNVKTLPMTPEEIRDHNEKVMSRLAPIFTENIKRALRPVLGPVAAALEKERKHQDKLLELEEKQLALEIRLKRRGVGRPQRRRRVSSARRLRPRTRQLGPRLSFPWKR